jgi:hypothetical protein
MSHRGSHRTHFGSRSRIEKRRKTAAELKERRDSLTDEQQLQRLDQLLGKDKGAVKERKRLADRIAEANKPKSKKKDKAEVEAQA